MSRRRAKLLIVCIAIGAILNITVAWGCAIWSRPDPAAARPLTAQAAAKMWNRLAPTEWKGDIIHAYRQTSFGVSIDQAFGADASESVSGDIPIIKGHSVIELRVGTPLALFSATGTGGLWTADRPEMKHAWRLASGVSWANINDGQIIPYCPLAAGLAVNTVFFAAIAWLMLRGPAEFRRRARQLRNRCQACGFLIGTSPLCSECGTPVTRGLRPVAAPVTKPPGGAGG